MPIVIDRFDGDYAVCETGSGCEPVYVPRTVFRLSHRRETLLFSPKMAFMRLTLHAQQRCARKRSAVLPRFFTPKRDSSPASQKANCKRAARKQAEHSSADCIGQAGAFDAINKISHAIGDPAAQSRMMVVIFFFLLSLPTLCGKK